MVVSWVFSVECAAETDLCLIRLCLEKLKVFNESDDKAVVLRVFVK